MRYRLQRHDGTDCSATMVPITVLRMVPIQRYRHILFVPTKCAAMAADAALGSLAFMASSMVSWKWFDSSGLKFGLSV